jgi:DNA-binding CsgD family transcriptional regulator
MGRRGRPPHPDILTPREWEVLGLLRSGASNEEIAEQLGVTLSTAKFHVSEIIGKLGVADRREAADWRGDRRATGILTGVGASLLERLRVPIYGLGAGACVVAVAVIGLLIWGLLTSRDSQGDAAVIQTAPHPSVIEFDTTSGTATRLDLGRDFSFAQWVDGGDLLAGYDAGSRAYVALRRNGTFVSTIMPQPDDGTLDAWLAPEHDGSRVMVYWEDRDAFSSIDVRTGVGENFTVTNDVSWSPQFSRDGESMAFSAHHDYYLGARGEIVPEPAGSLIERDGLVFATAFGADRALELAPAAWSPDGRYVLGVESTLTNGRYDQRTYRAYDLGETNHVVWERKIGANAMVAWAGNDRLYVNESPLDTDLQPPLVKVEWVDIATGASTPIDTPLSCCILSFSPDGRYAIAHIGDSATPNAKCALVDTESWNVVASVPPTTADRDTVFCTEVSWTPDGTKVIVSGGGI